MSAAGRDVHMTAIGGVGMSSLAGLLVAQGHRVRGSDLDVYPPASDELARLGVPVRKGYAAENLEPRPDLVVMGNAISADNPEAVAARRRGIPTLSLPEALELLLLPGRTPLVVAGTHGKTTTASFLAWVLETAGREPGWFIGGAPRDLPAGYALGSGAEFVLEGDEYDSAYFDKGPKFLHYRPAAVLLNAVEFDHADIYRDLEHVKASFARLLALLPGDAPLLVCADFPHALDVARESGARFTTFGSGADGRAGSPPGPSASSGAAGGSRSSPAAVSSSGPASSSPPAPAEIDWVVDDLSDGADGLSFVARGPSERFALRSPLLGRMNARNLLGVTALVRRLGVPPEAIVEAAATFRGVRRRQEVVVDGAVTLIDDFAHHPTAIAATLEAVRARYPGRVVRALFDPRSNTTRRRIFQEEIATALAGADHVLFGPVHRAALLDEADRFSPAEACARLASLGRTAASVEEHAVLADRVLAESRPGDVVVVLSNGSFGGIVPRLVAGLATSAA